MVNIWNTIVDIPFLRLRVLFLGGVCDYAFSEGFPRGQYVASEVCERMGDVCKEDSI